MLARQQAQAQVQAQPGPAASSASQPALPQVRQQPGAAGSPGGGRLGGQQQQPQGMAAAAPTAGSAFDEGTYEAEEEGGPAVVFQRAQNLLPQVGVSCDRGGQCGARRGWKTGSGVW